MPQGEQQLKYKRILLKLSGEALQGKQISGIDPGVLGRVASEIGQLVHEGVQVGIVIGGGNLFRGAALSAGGLDRVTGDRMGMLATVMNALALGDALIRRGIEARVMSAIPMGNVAEIYDSKKALRHFHKQRVVIFSAGTGNPFFTTDSAACLRGIEINADLVLKATKVDGVYDKDPVKHPEAVRFEHLTYDEILSQKLGVMDFTAICLVRDNDMPLRVFNMNCPGALLRLVKGGKEGTLVNGGRDD